MPEELLFTRFLNHELAGPVTAMLRVLHIEPQHPRSPIPNEVAMEVLVFGILLLSFILVRTRLSVESPGGLQHLFEEVNSFIQNQSLDMIGPHSERFTPFLVTLGLFILMCNLLGLVPGLDSPTAYPDVTLGCAVVTFLYYQANGFATNGIGYLKHFLGSVDLEADAASILLLAIEPISHLARVLSLTIRLYANMFAGDMVTLAFFSLIPIGVPVIFLGFHMGVAFVQAYIFVLLTTVYLAGAVAVEH